jgi:hypothetical protein
MITIETIGQIFGMTFVGIIMVCLAWTIVEYIVTHCEGPTKRNKKLLDRANKLMNKNK